MQFPSEGFLFLLVDIALCFLALLNFAVKACVNIRSVLMHNKYRFELLSTNRAAIGSFIVTHNRTVTLGKYKMVAK